METKFKDAYGKELIEGFYVLPHIEVGGGSASLVYIIPKKDSIIIESIRGRDDSKCSTLDLFARELVPLESPESTLKFVLSKLERINK